MESLTRRQQQMTTIHRVSLTFLLRPCKSKFQKLGRFINKAAVSSLGLGADHFE